MGMERLMSLIKVPQEAPLDVFVVSIFPQEALKLVTELRKLKFSCDFDLSNKKFAKQMDRASKIGAKFAIILGEEEINTNTLTLKNMFSGQQQTMTLEEVYEKIKNTP